MTLALRPALAAALLALAAAPVWAQSSDARFAATTLDVAGHGEAHAPPDMATIVLGVTADAPTAAEAMQADAAAMTRVIAALRAGAIEARDIRTSTLSLSPQYAYAQGAAPRLQGYQASNQVTVAIEDLTRLGRVADAVVGAGATSVGDISFGLKSRAAAVNYARLAAVKDLDDKAATLADAAGYHIKRLVNLTEQAAEAPGPVRPVFMAAAKAAAPTPVEAGEIVVSVDVTGEFELTH
ncbi:MAG TPA: SIMPL domain-containing protein [Caulobacteraceae bacterium]|jgi:hypothetical protein